MVEKNNELIMILKFQKKLINIYNNIRNNKNNKIVFMMF